MKRIFSALISLLFAASMAVAQVPMGVCHKNVAIDRYGHPAGGAQINICNVPYPTGSCGIQVYSDVALTKPLATPSFTADAFGNYEWCATGGTHYAEQVTFAGRTSVDPDIMLPVTKEWVLSQGGGSMVYPTGIGIPDVVSGVWGTTYNALNPIPANFISNLAEGQVTNLPSDLAAKEPGLGDPSTTGYVLSSTTSGVRSWVANAGASYPDITDTTGVSVNIGVPVTLGTGPLQASGTRQGGTSVTVPAGKDASIFFGSDNYFHCQLSIALGGGSCLPSGMVYPSGSGIPSVMSGVWGTTYNGSTPIPASYLPAPTASTLGGVESQTCTSGNHLQSITTAGAVTCGADTGGSGTFTVSDTEGLSGFNPIVEATSNTIGIAPGYFARDTASNDGVNGTLRTDVPLTLGYSANGGLLSLAGFFAAAPVAGKLVKEASGFAALSGGDTAIPVYITLSSGYVGGPGGGDVALWGITQCTFDGAGTVDHYVTANGTTSQCHDAGASIPSGVFVIGQLLSNPSGSGSSGTVRILNIPASSGSMVYPGTGVANSTGSAWGTSYGASNPFPSNFIPTLNQNTTGAAWTGTYTPAAGKVLGGSSPAAITLTSAYVDSSICSNAACGQNTAGNAATATALSTTGSNGTFWGVSGGVQGYYSPAGGGTVNSGTATHFAGYSTTGAAVSDFGGDFTYTSPHTYTFGASGIFNWTAATNFQFPGAVSGVATSNLQVVNDSLASNLHFWNGTRDMINLSLVGASPPANNAIIKINKQSGTEYQGVAATADAMLAAYGTSLDVSCTANITGAAGAQNMAKCPIAKFTLTGNVSSLSFSNMDNTTYDIHLIQDGTGGRTLSSVTGVNGLCTLDNAANAITRMRGAYDGTNFNVTSCTTYGGYSVSSYGTAYSGTPPGGSGLPNVSCWYDPTNKIGNCINDAAQSFGHVVYKASATAHNFLTNIPSTGIQAFAQPAFTDISGTAAAAQLPLATSAAVGGVQGDGSTLTITAGVIKCTTATNSQIGCVEPDGSTITISGGVISAVGGGGAPTFPVNPQTATYQVVAGDFNSCKTITVASGTFTVTLVASGSQPSNGKCIQVLNYGSGVVTIARSGQNINGGTTSLTLAAGSSTAPTGAFIVSDGTNYFAQEFVGAGAGGSVTSIATTSPITGGTITTSGTIACATCVTSAASLTNNKPVAGSGGGQGAVSGSLTMPPEFTVTDPFAVVYNPQPNSTLDANSPFLEHFYGRRWCNAGMQENPLGSVTGWCAQGTNGLGAATFVQQTSGLPFYESLAGIASNVLGANYDRAAQNSATTAYNQMTGRTSGIYRDGAMGLSAITTSRMGISELHLTASSAANFTTSGSQTLNADSQTGIAHVTLFYSSTQSNSTCDSTHWCLETSDGSAATFVTLAGSAVTAGHIYALHLYEDPAGSTAACSSSSCWCAQFADMTPTVGSWSTAVCSTTHIPAANTLVNWEDGYSGDGGTSGAWLYVGSETKWNP